MAINVKPMKLATNILWNSFASVSVSPLSETGFDVGVKDITNYPFIRP